MLLLDLSTLPSGWAGGAVMGLLFPAALGYYVLLGRVIRDRWLLLLLATVVLTTLWVWLDPAGVPRRFVTHGVGFGFTIIALPFVQRALNPRSGGQAVLVRSVAIALLVPVILMIGVAGFPTQAAYLLTVLLVVLLVHWSLGSILLGRSRRHSGTDP
jgi:hypothetical protein